MKRILEKRPAHDARTWFVAESDADATILAAVADKFVKLWSASSNPSLEGAGRIWISGPLGKPVALSIDQSVPWGSGRVSGWKANPVDMSDEAKRLRGLPATEERIDYVRFEYRRPGTYEIWDEEKRLRGEA